MFAETYSYLLDYQEIGRQQGNYKKSRKGIKMEHLLAAYGVIVMLVAIFFVKKGWLIQSMVLVMVSTVLSLIWGAYLLAVQDNSAGIIGLLNVVINIVMMVKFYPLITRR